MRKVSFIVADIFDDNLNTSSVSFFIADFSLLSFNSFTYKLLYCVVFILIKIKLLHDTCIQCNCIDKTFTVPCKNLKTVSFASSRMK